MLMFPRIVGFSGKIGVGKTTLVEAFLKKYPMYFKFAFGDNVKEEVSQFYNFPKDWCYSQEGKLKIVNPAGVFACLKSKFYRLLGISDSKLPRLNMTVREVMQWHGTDFRRAQDPKYWTKLMEVKLMTQSWAVIDDVRFKQETEVVKKNGGVLIRIEPYPEWKSGEYSNHASETELDDYKEFDLVLTPRYGELHKELDKITKLFETLNQ